MAEVYKNPIDLCGIVNLDANKLCHREARWTVRWRGEGRKLRIMKFCYRHRYAAYDLARETEIAEREVEANSAA